MSRTNAELVSVVNGVCVATDGTATVEPVRSARFPGSIVVSRDAWGECWPPAVGDLILEDGSPVRRSSSDRPRPDVRRPDPEELY